MTYTCLDGIFFMLVIVDTTGCFLLTSQQAQEQKQNQKQKQQHLSTRSGPKPRYAHLTFQPTFRPAKHLALCPNTRQSHL